MTQRIPAYDAEELLSLFCECNPSLIRLHVAENILLFDLLAEHFASSCSIELEDITYQPSYGTAEFRGELAAFLGRGFEPETPISADDISCFSGTRCALEVAGRSVFEADPGLDRGVLVPAPYWQGFHWIYEDQLGGKIVPVPLGPRNDFALTLGAIRTVYERTEPRPGALVLTQPNNPLGVNYERELLEEIYGWVLEDTPMHLFSDEIYAHCQVEGIRRSEFVSALALPITRRYPERVHVAWGFAKDFGVSGFRAGVLASRSEAVRAKVRETAIAGFSPMTSSNAWFLGKLFTTPPGGEASRPADALMEALAPRLAASFRATFTALERGAIPFFRRTEAAQFFWLDLRGWLDKVPDDPLAGSDLAKVYHLDALDIDPREKALNDYLCARAGVMLLPGQVLSSATPGFFRLCFTAEPAGRVLEAVRAIAQALRELG